MSEPLSRGTLEAEREVLRHAVAAPGDPPIVARLIRYAHAERDRVAELEKEGAEVRDHFARCRVEDKSRADRAEAGLAAAQEALKEDPRRWSFWTLVTIAHWLLEAEYPRDVFVSDGTTGDPGPRFLGYLRRALAELPDGTLDDALARGGGQQETGQ